jgi:CheY-like chemotaxis protein
VAELLAEILLSQLSAHNPRAIGTCFMASDPIKILIVDDDEQVLIELERLLESEGYSTTTAWSRDEALAYAKKWQFNLLLVDEHVGGADGGVLLAELKQRQPNALAIQLHTRTDRKEKSNHTVCKWEHAEVTARIRNCIAA